MATARSIWTGTISFGLVNIPVKLQSAVQSEELPLHMLAKKDMAPIKYARIDTKTGKEVDWKDIVKGYEYAKGKFVVVDEEDFQKASPQKSKSIDIVQFVKAEEIDPIYFEKPYYLLPAKGGEKTYRLLVKALEESGVVGIAEFMLRNREHVCAIKPYKGLLLLDQMRYEEELKELPELASGRVAEKELQLAIKLIAQLTESFNPAAFKDNYVSALKKVIKAKAAGKHIRIAEPEERSATVKDLMEVLKQSLEGKKKKRA
ncbi:MAG: Ku protein [Chitinophagaceae bacterium]|nr:MAG: Ku protein [Chitinophagaceae bacterium]